VHVEHTILASNTATSTDPELSATSTITTDGANLVGINQGVDTIFPEGDLVGTLANPLYAELAPIADNGGPTQTVMLLAGSPAIDQGVASLLPLLTDQRGFARVLGGGIDIGAYEAGATNFNLDGLTVEARIDPTLAAGVRFEISTDPDFLPTTSVLAGAPAIDYQPGIRAEIFLGPNLGSLANLDHILENNPHGTTVIPNLSWSNPGGFPSNGYPDADAAADNGGANSTNLFAQAVPGKFTSSEDNYGVKLTGQIHIPSDSARGGVETVRFRDGVNNYAYLEVDGVGLIDDNFFTDQTGSSNGGGAQATLDVSAAKFDDGEWVSICLVVWVGLSADNCALVWDALDVSGADDVTLAMDSTIGSYNPSDLADGAQVSFANHVSDWIPAENLRWGQPLPGATDGPRAVAQFSFPSGVAEDSLGNLFIADTGNNRIRMLTPAGEVSTIAGTGSFGKGDGPGEVATFSFPAGIATGPDGNLYVADTLNHSIRKLTRPAVAGLSWTVTTVAGDGDSGYVDGASSVARFSHPHGLVLDALGNIFVADSVNHVIRKVDLIGGVSTYAGTGSMGDTDDVAKADAEFNYPSGLAFDNAGNLFIADRDNHRIRKIVGGIVSTHAGQATAGKVDGTGIAARFNRPVALGIDGANNLYVSDEGNHTIRKIAPGGEVSTVVGTGAAGADNGNSTLARFNQPAGLLVNRNGDIVIADTKNHVIRRIVVDPIIVAANTGTENLYGLGISATLNAEALGLDPDTTYYVRWYSSVGDTTQMLGQSFYLVDAPTVVTESTIGLTSTAATLQAMLDPKGSTTTSEFEISTDPDLAGPWQVSSLVPTINDADLRGVAVRANGFVYVADRDEHVIREYDATGMILRTIGADSPGSMGGTFSVAQFDHPNGLAIDGDMLYVADEFNHCIRRINLASDMVDTLSGSGIAGFADGADTVARFLFPTGVAVDANGDVYVADTGNHRIRKIDKTSGGVTTVAGSGVQGFADGAGAGAAFDSPAALAVNAPGEIYVADTGNHLIRVISAGNSVVTIAGNGSAGFLNGAGVSAQFSSPTGIAIDGTDGTIYISDRDNHRIRRIDAAGYVSTLAGSGVADLVDSPLLTSELHPATAAAFDQPTGIAINSAGSLFVAEAGNADLRSIVRGVVPTVTVSPAAVGVGDRMVSASTAGPPEMLSLLRGATYYYRALATNGRGLSTGEILSFVTPQSEIVVHNGDSSLAPPLNPGEVVDFGTTPLNTPQVRTFTIKNLGDFELDISGITRATPISGGFSVSSVGTSLLPPGGETSFTVTLESSSADQFTDGIIIASDDVDEAEIKFAVTGEVLSPPVLTNVEHSDVTATEVTFSAKVDPMGSPTDVMFEFSKDENFGTTLEVLTKAGSSVGFANGCGIGAMFRSPSDVAVDAFGNVYVADTGNHRIRRITPDGDCAVLAGSPVGGFADGTGADAQFSSPEGIAIDALGNLFVADTGNNRIRRVTPTGVVTTVAGFGGAGAFTEGLASAARFDTPTGIDVGPDGSLYIADTGNDRVRILDVGGEVSTLLHTGLASPRDVIVGVDGTVWVADTGNNRVLRLISGAANLPIPGFSAPAGLTFDSEGNVLVADTGNHRIKKIVGATVSDFAGTGTAGANDGTGSTAMFDGPTGLTVSSGGTVYIADLNNHRIRQINLAARKVIAASGLTRLGNLSLAFGADTSDPLTLRRAAIATRLEIALNAMPSIATTGGVDVNDGGIAGTFVISWREPGARDLIGAEVTGSVDPPAVSVTETTPGDGSNAEVQLLTLDNSPLMVIIDLAGLEPLTQYFYRAIATNAGGEVINPTSNYPTFTTGDNDSALTGLSVNGTPVGAFDPCIYSYPVTVSGNIIAAQLIAISSSTNATIVVRENGVYCCEIDSGVASVPMPLSVGDNIFQLEVVSADNSTLRTYTVLITRPESGFVQWQEDKFGSDASNPGISGALANVDSDDFVNMLEYAFDLDPNTPSNEDAPFIGRSGGFLTITYRRLLSASDIVYKVEWSTDLQTWSEVGVTEDILAGQGTALVDLVVGKVPDPEQRKFIRVSVSFL
jgi:sugar lactone lactonase YvrE